MVVFKNTIKTYIYINYIVYIYIYIYIYLLNIKDILKNVNKYYKFNKLTPLKKFPFPYIINVVSHTLTAVNLSNYYMCSLFSE